jgi:exportin-1
VYPEIYRLLRSSLIDLMAKPKEVLLSLDEDGEVEEEHFEDTEQEVLYEQMRETLIYLTHIDTTGMNQTI